MSRFDVAVLTLYYLTLGSLAIYSVHRLYLVRLRRKFTGALESSAAVDVAQIRWPAMTVQLPLFNEPNVAGRLIDAVAAIEYPGTMDIQVLDDSTDETSAIVAERVAAWRARGTRIEHIRRTSRAGYKAGALAHGMALSGSELFAVFDADFVPPSDIFRAMVPRFADAGVGMVQARWGHLNRSRTLLTRVQAIFLDGHFAVESAGRFLSGRFFNFNGTAGIWRRQAIEDAGGWSASTLTEDLDLSYRAQLAGWKFVFLPSIEVPAELPATLSGFQEQQHRWAKGSIQTARKILPRLLAGDLPLRIKIEAFFHLTNNAAYLLTLLVALLMVPAIVIRQRLGLTWSLLVDLALFLASTVSVLLFYVEGQRLAGRRTPTPRELLTVLPVGIAMSIPNAAAVIEGLFETGGHFRRTPKRGAAASEPYDRPPRLPLGEMLMAAFFIAATGSFIAARQWMSIPFLTLFLSGYALGTVKALRERLRFRHAR
ncbi:MAG TPA: glycosyltransferase [Thermoanaerobaculia bacterium]|nr:glycosyltransferase [Thermoanaerobaculia bacterium]